MKVTRWPVEPLTFSKKNPSRAIPRSTYIHPPSLAKIGQRTSEEIGNKQTDRQTDKQTNAARFIVWLLSYYNSSSVCLFVSFFLPYVLRGPLTDLRQTWWVYVGWPPICPWGVLFRKGQRVDGSTGYFHFPLCYICGRLTPHHCKKHTAYNSRQHHTHATPLTKAHGIFCSLETGNFLVKAKCSKSWRMPLYLNATLCSAL